MNLAVMRLVSFAALAVSVSSQVSASELRDFVAGKYFERGINSGKGSYIMLCFDRDGSLTGADFDGGHGVDIGAEWAALTDIVINGTLCRVMIVPPDSMTLSDCYYQGLWKTSARSPKG